MNSSSFTALCRILLASLAILIAGCSPYAIVARRSGPPIEARVLSSDARTITLEQSDGRTLTVARQEVIDIDHPGNVAMTLGLPNTVVGSLFAVITVFMMPAAIEQGWPEDSGEQLGAAPVALGFGLFSAVNLAIGLPVFLWGSDLWFTSTGNAQPALATHSSTSVPVRIGPGSVQVTF